MKKYLLLIIFLSLTTLIKAQLSSDSLEYRIRPDSLKTGELHLSVFNFNYQRNYEYFNKIQDGYTLFGTQLEPQLVYYPHPRLVVMAGIHLRKDYGTDGIYKTYPLFSIKYQKGNTTLINGVLEGNIQHRFVEPIFDFERKITDPVEYGTQFLIEKPSLFLDAFISWKKMIYKPSPVQEQVFGGLSTDISLLQNHKLNLSIPIQFTAYHQGGQIDTVDVPLKTLVNTAIGFKLKFHLAGFVKNIRAENYLLSFKEFSPTKILPFSNGYGVFLNAGVDTRYGTILGTYWRGDGYISIAGMPIYQSVSQQINNTGYTQKHRELVMLRYAYQRQLLPNLYLDFRVEPLVDLQAQKAKIEFSNSAFLVYRQQFLLKKIKQ